jgi:xylulokinase
MLADVFAKPVVTLETQEGSAYGAALLSLVGTHVYANVPEACRAVVRETERVHCRSFEASQYARGHQVYAALYPTLKPIYRLIQNAG